MTNSTFAVEQVADSNQMNTTHFYIGDHLGSAQMEFTASGWPASSSQFGPYGGEINPQPTTNHYKFTGKERDTESGLDYFEARYYGSSMGRFMSPDEPFIGSDPADPQSWNLYSYVRNNPLTRIDPDGHDCIYADGQGGGTLQRGDCTNAGGKDDNGVYVNGHVDENSFRYNANNNSSSFSYTPDGAGPGTIGVGTLQGPNLNGGFEPGSLAAGVFGAQSASTWNNAAGTVNAVAGFEMDIMAPWAGAAVNCMGGGSKVGCAANMALAVLPAGGEMRAGRQLLQASRELTAAEYISKNLKGGINAVFPGQFKGMAIKEIEAAAKNGDRAARTAMKLLTDGRFTK